MTQTAAPSILYLPASGPAGSGEYMRCLMLARAVERRWPRARARFVVNRHAAYARDVPFPAVLIDSSPTHDTAAVNEVIRADRPDIVIFDNAGRAAQFAAARAAGAATVLVSSRPNARRKGLRLNRIRWLDQHWVAQPEWATPPPTAWERFKKRLRPRLRTYHLDAIFEESEPGRRLQLQRELGIEARPFIVFCAGGGGQFSRGPRAPEVMLQAAAAVADRAGPACVVVLGPNYDSRAPRPSAVIALGKLSNARLMDLLHDATLVVTSGGDVLMQALVQRRVCIAVAVAGDQPERIRRCAERGLVEPAALAADAIARAAARLLESESRRATMLRNVDGMGMRNGLTTAVEAIEQLTSFGRDAP